MEIEELTIKIQMTTVNREGELTLEVVVNLSEQ